MWKTYIEKTYQVSYVRDVNTSTPDSDVSDSLLAPANGGVRVMPTMSDESSRLNINKSIWYRCAKNRMAIYDFDMISLFGGTNDEPSVASNLGTINDIPYVDDSSTIDVQTTDVWSDSLTFAQCLMGCILMLKRDFPKAEIVIPTVMYCNRGNSFDESAFENMAILQAQIANKYKLKCVPFYWDNPMNANSNKAFTADGVHPNTILARKMAISFADTLGF